MKNLNYFLSFLGYPRSGHTLVAAILNANPNVYCSNQLFIMNDFEKYGSKEKLFDYIKNYYGMAHISFSVGSKENVDEVTSKLQRDGYTVLDGPRKTGDGYYESAVFDPEKNRLEITI